MLRLVALRDLDTGLGLMVGKHYENILDLHQDGHAATDRLCSQTRSIRGSSQQEL